MNEITNIHLGRQAFTIAVDAHHALRVYLKAIGEQTGDNKEVVEEVELRMAELLRERGVSGDKVVIMADINYIKEQLGEPADFNDAEESARHHGRKSGHAASSANNTTSESAPKRLFRDTDHAMLAGVSAGLAAYIGVDPLIVRLIFVLLTISGGAGVLVYILLWVLVPAAESESDRLQMKGKPVTIENIKQAVDQADVPGAAKRARSSFEKVFLVAGKLLLAIIGIGFIVTGISLMLAASGIGSFTLVHGVQLGTAGPIIFPIGGKEVVSVISVLAVLLVLALLSVLVGRAMIRRKWGVSGWVMAALTAVFIVSAGIGVATITDSIEPVRTRYEQAQQVVTHPLPPFKTIKLNVGSIATRVEYADTYSYEIDSFGHVDTSKIAVLVQKDGVLYVDASTLHPKHNCTMVCPYGSSNIQIIVRGPVKNMRGENYTNSIKYYGKDGELLFVEPQTTDEPAAPTTPEVPAKH